MPPLARPRPHARTDLSLKTFLAKILGLTSALAAGYVIGKEGPLVHLSATLSVRQPGPKRPPPRLRTAPHLPLWIVQRLRPLLRTPQRSLRSSEARRGLRSVPLAGPKSIEMVRMLLRCSS